MRIPRGILIQRSLRVVAALVVAIAMPALALDDEGGRAGRVASVQGALSHKADDAAAWTPVGQNYPVAEGASLALAPARPGAGPLDRRSGRRPLVMTPLVMTPMNAVH